MPKPLSGREKEAFLSQANIKVTQEEKQNYKDLIAENHDVFSKDEQDLGWVNNFERTIKNQDKN